MAEENLGEEKRLPKYSGVIQTRFRDPKTRRTLGRILLWESRSTNPKAPVLYGRLQTKYGISSVALWQFVQRQKKQADRVV